MTFFLAFAMLALIVAIASCVYNVRVFHAIKRKQQETEALLRTADARLMAMRAEFDASEGCGHSPR